MFLRGTDKVGEILTASHGKYRNAGGGLLVVGQDHADLRKAFVKSGDAGYIFEYLGVVFADAARNVQKLDSRDA